MTKPRTSDTEPGGSPRPGAEVDDALAAAARGVAPTSDDAATTSDENGGEDASGEIDAMGEAAGIPIPDDAPLGDNDEIARRDAHRWELDPGSAEDHKP